MFVLSFFLLYSASTNSAKAAPFAVSFQVFYDELSPYGDWVEDPHYGFIWIPFAEQGFQPYRTNGHWVMSTYGNTWVSNYDWGWAPFHYGRWFFSDMYGWAWIPGYEWGPAWVNWRTGRGYYGWFPLGPRVQFYASVRFPVYAHWVFVPRRRLLSRNVYRYYLPGRNVNVIYNQTTIINNTRVYNNQTYITGPSRSELRRVTRRDVPVYQVSEGRRPGRATIDRNRLSLYKPEIRSNDQSRAEQLRPRRITSSRDYNANRAKTRNRASLPETSARSSVRREALHERDTSPSRSARRENNIGPENSISQPAYTRQRNYDPEMARPHASTRQRSYAPSNTRRQVTPGVNSSTNRSQSGVTPERRNINTQRMQRGQRSSAPNSQQLKSGNVRQEIRKNAPSSSVNRSLNSARKSQQIRSTTRKSNPSVNNRSRSNTRVAPAPSSRATRANAPARRSTSGSRRGN
ncbi:DUF6600 domain-containing protein [Cyclobacterium lianum]|nr:DUF6600 domain-containing protein [Cyclobacterium lianum]